jgi:hypothetical protein
MKLTLEIPQDFVLSMISMFLTAKAEGDKHTQRVAECIAMHGLRGFHISLEDGKMLVDLEYVDSLIEVVH